MDTAIQTAQTMDINILIAMAIMIIASCSVMVKLMMMGFNRLEQRLDKMQETITDIDRRLCRLEGAFQAKECCLLKSESSHKIAEGS